MGNSPQGEHGLNKGQGFRIISIDANSPLQGKVQPFFDFIIQVIPKSSQKSVPQILDKLSPSSNKDKQKDISLILRQNAQKQVQLKIVSTKYRNVKNIDVILNKNQPNSNNLLGIHIRKQRFDQAFQTYCPISQIQNNSPIKKSGIREGQYMIGCVQYPYKNIDNFMEGVYQVYFDKNIQKKSVNLAIYDIGQDSILIRQVQLSRGWGGKGLLGCQFFQGLLYKFPSNLDELRKKAQQKQLKRRQAQQLRLQLGDCDGVSKNLIQTLNIQKNKKGKHLRHIKGLLSGIAPPNLSILYQRKNDSSKIEEKQRDNSNDNSRVLQLEKRVQNLQKILFQIKDSLNKIYNEQILMD